MVCIYMMVVLGHDTDCTEQQKVQYDTDCAEQQKVQYDTDCTEKQQSAV